MSLPTSTSPKPIYHHLNDLPSIFCGEYSTEILKAYILPYQKKKRINFLNWQTPPFHHSTRNTTPCFCLPYRSPQGHPNFQWWPRCHGARLLSSHVVFPAPGLFSLTIWWLQLPLKAANCHAAARPPRKEPGEKIHKTTIAAAVSSLLGGSSHLVSG